MSSLFSGGLYVYSGSSVYAWSCCALRRLEKVVELGIVDDSTTDVLVLLRRLDKAFVVSSDLTLLS